VRTRFQERLSERLSETVGWPLQERRTPSNVNPQQRFDPGMQNVAAASELLKPYDARIMRCYPVSTRINSVANDDEECSRPVELAEVQNRLFV
jgi:hypothetical protein